MFRWFGLALALGLAGCATAPIVKPVSDQNSRLMALSVWRLEGRIGVQTAKDGWNANLSWEHDAGQDRLRISGPFNQGVVSIVIQGNKIFINEGNGTVLSSADPDAMLKARLGFTVPLSSVKFWLLGMPAPDDDSSGIEDGFSQSGWMIHLQRFMSSGDWVLPQKLMIQGNGVKLRLIIDEWVI